jgi:hypothetical protein
MMSDRDIERSKTMMTEMARKSVKGGRNNLRSVGDMNSFIGSGIIQQLVALESSLEKQFGLPVTALRTYTRNNAEEKKKKKERKKEEEVNLLLR